MARIMTLSGLVTAGLLGAVFLLDLVAGYPFGQASITMDVAMLVCAVILGFLSWSVQREQSLRR